MEMKATTVIQL